MPPQLPQNPPWRARSAGPQHRYICAEDLWRPVREPAGLDIVESGPTIDPLYDLPFEHGLRDQGNTEQPDVIGVGVLPGYQRDEIGAAFVSTCSRAILDAGRVPYYSTDLSNLRSQSVAIRCGFVPAWTEAYVYVPRSERVAGDYLGLKRSRST